MCLLLKWFMENMLSCGFWKQHRLPHKTISKSMWVREMAGLPRAGKVRPQRGSLWATLGSIFVDDGVLVKRQQKMFILTLHWGLRILFYVPATPSRTSNRKSCSLCFVHTTWIDQLVSLFSSTNICQWSIERAQYNWGAWARKAT